MQSTAAGLTIYSLPTDRDSNFADPPSLLLPPGHLADPGYRPDCAAGTGSDVRTTSRDRRSPSSSSDDVTASCPPTSAVEDGVSPTYSRPDFDVPASELAVALNGYVLRHVHTLTH